MKKIIFIIYASVIAVTVLCALALPQYVDLGMMYLPAAVAAFLIVIGLLIKNGVIYFSGGRPRIFRILQSGDFKFTKNEKGEGVFTEVYSFDPELKAITAEILGYSFIICAALAVPCAFFLPAAVKWYSIGLILVAYIVGCAIAVPIEIRRYRSAVDAEKARREQWQRELEEQKKREEMGKWK